MIINCPKCKQKYKVNSEDCGKKCKCKKCDEIFIIEASEDFLNELDDIIEKVNENKQTKRINKNFSLSLDKLDNLISLKYKFLILIIIFLFLLIGIISLNKSNSIKKTASSNKVNVNAKSESDYKAGCDYYGKKDYKKQSYYDNGISSEPLTQRETQREYEQRLYDSGMSSEPLTQEEKNLVKSSAKESGISEENSEYLIRLLKYKD